MFIPFADILIKLLFLLALALILAFLSAIRVLGSINPLLVSNLCIFLTGFIISPKVGFNIAPHGVPVENNGAVCIYGLSS